MALTATDTGYGTTIAYTGHPFAEILSLEWSGISREAIETSHMGTTGSTTNAKTYIAADLYDAGEITVECNLDDVAIAWLPTAAAATTTINFAAQSSTWAATCFATNVDVSVPLDDRMTISVTLKVAGEITVV
jgi:hypothetical protein|tara:strand:- start:3477 stop:3875 length:399 start_codon:yes stop_codon:yes gene_type:complete